MATGWPFSGMVHGPRLGVREPLMSYRIHGESLSANKLVAAKYSWRLLRDVEGFPFAKALWLFSGYAFEAVKLRLGGAREKHAREG